jgi:predicted Rossmann fold flavoprotein
VPTDVFDVAVIGAGAAGLAAAAEASKTSWTCVLERQAKPGRRLLATGNGRGNVSHNPVLLTDYNQESRRWLRFLPGLTETKTTADFLRELSVLTFEDEAGRLYPRSRQTQTLLRAFEQRLRDQGVPILTNTGVNSIRPPLDRREKKDEENKDEENKDNENKGLFVLETEGGQIRARAVIVAVGGMAAPNLGGGDQAKKLLVPLDFNFSPLKPALVPLLLCDRSLIRDCAGIRFRGIARLSGGPYKSISVSEGEFQISRAGLSGIAAMRLARAVETEGAAALTLDLAPDLTENEVLAFLTEAAERHLHIEKSGHKYVDKRPDKQADKRDVFLFDGLLPDKLSAWLEKKIAKESGKLRRREEMVRRVEAVKHLKLMISGTLGFDAAQIQAGGVLLDQVIPETLETKKIPGLFLAGEILDVDGDTGGYNLHFAFVSGLTAGKNAAAYAISVR